MSLSDVRLDDKYDLSKGRIFLTGTQAIIRLTLMQKERDKRAGLNTAGYVSGYRGSPVGGLDLQFARAAKHTQASDVLFQTGLNEDLAATAIWGAQQAEMRGEGARDGVFCVWYGKGPGVDRTGDAFRHANTAGTSKHGGVLALMGDDHGAESSTIPHQSEFALIDAMMPVLNPAGVQELLDYGILGWALSRYSGCWVGLKCVHDNIESTAVVDGAVDRIEVKYPKNFDMPDGGLNIRPWDDRFAQEERMHIHKRFAAVSFARANKLDRIVIDAGKTAKIGIVTAGKSYLDLRQALEGLGIDDATAAKLGLRVLKIGMVWPLDSAVISEFVEGLDQIIVIEEKRSLLETQIREQLYNEKARPLIIGKKDEHGEHLFKASGTLEPNEIAIALAKRLLKKRKNAAIAKRLEAIEAAMASVRNAPDLATRIPYFCSGCPHNSSTVLPDGGRGYAGIGCHWMAQFVPERKTEGSTHMGAEGANWIGEAPFSKRGHVFQNLGDGTYNHSGILAIRAAVAAGVNITYKILFNDAVAMTGGQMHDGGLNVPMIANQVRAEGVERIAVVSDEPDKYPHSAGFPAYVTFNHRDDLQSVQEELMKVKGVSVLIYDQTCAAEKRRRRKRGTFPNPQRRVFINELVCEGCGDCGVQSNCVAIGAVETEFGRKRQIDQSMCNKDFSCLKGFCPSFVTIEGGELRPPEKPEAIGADATPFPVLPEPELPDLSKPFSMLITGIGGTGVVTIGQVLGTAAHMESKGAGIIDMAGLAQKNGAVVSHLKLAAKPEDIASIRITDGGADLILGCDLVTSASERILSAASRERTHAIVNNHKTMPAQFTQDADFKFPGDAMEVQIEARIKPDAASFFNATEIATQLMGDSIAANMFTLGFAYQRGLVPVSAEAILRAIELNGVAVAMNQEAFVWGRRAGHDLASVEKIIAARLPVKAAAEAPGLDDMIAGRVSFLTDYQDAAYAERYRGLVDDVRRGEIAASGKDTVLTPAVARYFFKLMAYKDEYEVARLYTDGVFDAAVKAKFTGDYEINYHLAPPLLAKKDPRSGHLRKRVFGPGMRSWFALLARFKGLRGSALDIFGYSQERRTERALIVEYKEMIGEIMAGLTAKNLGLAREVAALPEMIRGFGHVKLRHLGDYQNRREELLTAYRNGKTRAPLRMAAE